MGEVLSAWLAALPTVLVPLGAGLGAGAVLALRRGWSVRRGVVWAALVVGITLAIRQASVVDDAFISFRYAQNLLAGEGLVYNPGEAVEGFTNLLWTVLVAAGSAVTGAELPLVALALGGAAFVGNVLVCARIGGVVAGDGRHVPIAAALLAVQYTVTSFATTGLETGAAMLAVQLGALGLVTRRPVAAGVGFALATLLRPDQALFYAAGGVVWLGADARTWLRYAAPALLLVASEAWRVATYGDWLPNTFYAKDGGGSYWSQGWVYAAEHHLGGHLWVVLAVAAAALVVPSRTAAERDLRRFAAVAIPLFELYVARLGGDFMAGRFYVSLWPLALLCAEGVVHGLAASRWGWLAGAALGATLRGGSLVPAGTIRWYLADEGTIYPLVGWSPVTIDHSFWRVGQLFRDRLEGLTPTLATGNIGFVGYYSELPLIDVHGLTDRTVARTTVKQRSHPGHEKMATLEYLRSRGVTLVLSPSLCARSPLPELSTLRVDGWPTSRPLCLLTYEPELVEALRERGFTAPRLDPWLDGYVAALGGRPPEAVRRELQWLDEFTFRGGPDARRDAIVSWLARSGGP